MAAHCRVSLLVLLLMMVADTARAQVLKFNPEWSSPGNGPTTAPSISGSWGGGIAGGSASYVTITASTLSFANQETLEWMATDSAFIILASVTDVTSTTTVTVEESIKGGLVPGRAIVLRLEKGNDDCYRDDKVLLFLNESKFSVLYPFIPRAGRSAIVLSRSPQVFCMDRTLLTKPQEIIDAARAASKFAVEPGKRPFIVFCDTPLGPRSLLLPPDERVETLAHTWAASDSLEDRVVAMRALHNFKSDQNIALAQRFLWVTRTRTARGQGKWQVGFYAVRAEAHSLLADWNVPHPQLPEMGPVYSYQPLSFSRASLLWPAGALFFIVALAIIRRRGHRLPFSYAIALFCIAGVICLPLLWVRSKGTIDEVMFRIGDNHHELASYQGGLQYQVTHEWTLPPKIVYGSFDLKLQDDIWSSSALNPVVARQFIGFMSGHGHLPGPAGVIHPYTLFRLPYWILILPFAIVLIYQSHLLRRQLRRRRLGLCRNCGYDLRENRDGKCPECGISLPPRASDSSNTIKTQELIT